MKPDLWILSCAPGSRADEAARLFARLDAPGVLITTQPDPVPEDFMDFVTVLLFDSEEINISKWWTMGLDHIASFYVGHPNPVWDVLLVETDVDISPQDVDRMRTVMREQDCVMAGIDFYHQMQDKPLHVRRDNSVWRKEARCIGMAQMIAGETGIRHDPEFRWWLADDDFEWAHRVGGGTVLLSGLSATHTGTQGPLTGSRLQSWEEDQPKFVEKWGALPAQGGIPDGQ